MDENKDNVVPIKVDPPLTSGEEGATRTAGQKVADHLDEHKAKYVASIILAVLIGLLQSWPTICPSLPGVLSCAKSQSKVDITLPILELEKGKLDGAGGGNE